MLMNSPTSDPSKSGEAASPLDRSFVETLPDSAMSYAVAVLPGFEGLKYAASLLAGVLVLAFTGAGTNLNDHSLERMALAEIEQAEAVIRMARVTERTAHHHHHLKNALTAIRHVAERLQEAFVIGAAGNFDQIISELNHGWDELRRASKHLPGFEVIDFSQSCCAIHARNLRSIGCQ
jgi:signal transduction histidine kinase